MSEWTQEVLTKEECAIRRAKLENAKAHPSWHRYERGYLDTIDSLRAEIERLRGELDSARESVTAWGHDDGKTHMGDVVERLCKRIKRTDDDYRELVLETDAREQRLRERIAELEDALRWIPVDERLPEDGDWVFVTGKHWLAPRVLQWLRGKWMYRVDYDEFGEEYRAHTCSVTHWRPLGPLPGEE